MEDLYKKLGFRLGLDNLAKETLNHGKSATGSRPWSGLKKEIWKA
jgi:hypothetical protein